MHTSSSAKRTCSDSRSASLYTATVSMPSSRQARMTRRAISPRLAIRTFLNTDNPRIADLARGAVGDELRLAHQGVRSWRSDFAPLVAVPLKVRSEAELIPEALSANSLGLVE